MRLVAWTPSWLLLYMLYMLYMLYLLYLLYMLYMLSKQAAVDAHPIHAIR